LPLAAAAHSGHRPPLSRRLCASRRSRPSSRGHARNGGGPPDRDVDARAPRRERAAGGDRARRSPVSPDGMRARARPAPPRPGAREQTLGGLGAARPDGHAAVPPLALRRSGARQAMTDPERLDSFELPAPTVWPMVVALGVTLGFTGLVPTSP